MKLYFIPSTISSFEKINNMISVICTVDYILNKYNSISLATFIVEPNIKLCQNLLGSFIEEICKGSDGQTKSHHNAFIHLMHFVHRMHTHHHHTQSQYFCLQISSQKCSKEPAHAALSLEECPSRS
jgi:hypothetical protein